MPVSNNISIVISTKRLNITVQTASPSAQNAQDTDRDENFEKTTTAEDDLSFCGMPVSPTISNEQCQPAWRLFRSGPCRSEDFSQSPGHRQLSYPNRSAPTPADRGRKRPRPGRRPVRASVQYYCVQPRHGNDADWWPRVSRNVRPWLVVAGNRASSRVDHRCAATKGAAALVGGLS